MIIDIRARLLRKELRELQAGVAFWRRTRLLEKRPSELTMTLGSLQQRIDQLKADLATLEARQ